MAYAFSGQHWDDTQFTWSFALSTFAKDSGVPFSARIAGDQTHEAFVRDAIATWSGVAGLGFIQVEDSISTDLRFGWGRFGLLGPIGQTNYNYDGVSNLIAPDVIIRLEDPAEKPLQQERTTGTTVYAGTATAPASVALHELGHALGLAHNGDAASIMFPTAGAANRQLTADDKFSIQLLYGDFSQNFRATEARDIFYGFAGTDSVTWNGRVADFTISRSGGGYAVSRNANPADRDILFDVEALVFSDARIAIGPSLGLFDPVAYARANPDVVAAGLDPRQHFDASGWREGRSPGGVFDPAAYLGANPDVRAAAINPLGHYETHGWREGRDPIASFDVRLYLARNPDVAAAGIEPLAHYLLSGRAEGRFASPALGNTITGGFDAQYYLLNNLDVGRAGVNPYQHWQQNGRFEGRAPDLYFDTSGYLGKYVDVAQAGIDPLAHYTTQGWKEGRDPSAAFDTRQYLAAYADVARSGLNPLDHFLNNGIYEGRSAFGDGVFF